MTADGSSSLSKNNDSFVAFSKEIHDLSLWFGGDSILETIGNQLQNGNLDSIKGVEAESSASTLKMVR